MKHLIVGLLAILCASVGLFAQTTEAQRQKLTLRVTSSSDKPVSFVASIFFKTDNARLDYTMQQTPYEITVESNYVNAAIIKTSGDGDLVVNLLKSEKVGDQPDLKASSSTIVVVGTTNAEKGIYYQQTF
jgi:hypothetical protein